MKVTEFGHGRSPVRCICGSLGGCPNWNSDCFLTIRLVMSDAVSPDPCASVRLESIVREEDIVKVC